MRGGDPAQAIERMMAADANGDGKLSRDEMPEQMAVRIFDRADTNKDGFVDKIEIEIIVKEGGLRGGQGAGQGGGQGAGGAGRGGAPSFEGSMKQANRGFQALNKSALDASTLTADLASVQTLQMGLVGSKGGIAGVKMSDAAKAKFGEDTAKYQSELRRQILDVIMISFDIEKAILNGDTALDILTTNFNGLGLTVNLGNGDGTFQPSVDVLTSVEQHAIGIGLADFDADGKLDVAVGGPLDEAVLVLRGDGVGAFTSIAPMSTGSGSRPTHLAVGDLNGDLRPDAVYLDMATEQMKVLLNNCMP